MANLNALPVGWLGFLGIKNGGKYPQVAAETLSPTWDLSSLYLGTNSRQRSDKRSITSIGAQAFFTVPQGEVWVILLQSAATGTLAATQSILMGLQITDAAGLVTIQYTPHLPPFAAGDGQRAAIGYEGPLIAGPGQSVGINAVVFANGPIEVTLATRYCVLPI